MAKGDIVDRNIFNSLQTQTANLLGVGSGNTGYGQQVSSAQISSGAVISTSLFNTIRSDLARIWTHQRGTSVVDSVVIGAPNLKIATTGSVVSDYFSQYQAFITSTNGVSINPLLVVVSQQTSGIALSSTARSTAWGGATAVISHTVTVTFAGYTQGALTVSAADHIRCFFNAGGSLQVKASRTGGSVSVKNTTWTAMLSGFGTLSFAAAGTSITGTLNTGFTLSSSTGFRSLTTGGATVTILSQPGPAGVYAENDYIVQVSRPTTNTLRFTITFRDDDIGDQTGLGAGVDEEVDGTLTSIVECTRASGANVDVPAPSGTATAIA